MDISIIVPTLNESGAVDATLATTRGPAVREVIVVDGGSTDDTVEKARFAADQVLSARRGRASQMNAGAAAAAGDVLLFLHADTVLPVGFDTAVVGALDDERCVGGRFDVWLEPSNALLRVVGTLINLRSRMSRIATGDQAIFVRRRVFHDLGGFPALPLMEDIAFSRALKRAGRVACLRMQVVTSSRRWQRDGVLRTIGLMWWLRFLFWCGVSPARLRQLYADTR